MLRPLILVLKTVERALRDRSVLVSIRRPSRRLLAMVIALVLPGIASSQSMTVMGGNEKARECYDNTELAGDLEFISPGLLTPCDYALDHVSLSRADRSATYTNRGVLYYLTEKYDRALVDFGDALELSPDVGEIYVNRGNLFYLTRDYDDALDDYNKALELNIRQMHRAHLNRGMLYERRGNTILAEADYRAALQYLPSWTLAQQRLERLLLSVEDETKAAAAVQE